MLKSGRLWLSHLSLSNDSMEGEWFLRKMAEEIDDMMVPEISGGYILDFSRSLLREVHSCGFCLSEQGDVLSQWRGYADDGQGVCIGFQVEDIMNLINSETMMHEESIDLIKVEYSEEEQRKESRNIIYSVIDLLKTLNQRDIQRSKNYKISREKDLFADLVSMETESDKTIYRIQDKLSVISTLLYKYKNPAFFQEQEWRILFSSRSTNSERFSYRSSGNRIISYFEVDAKSLFEEGIASVTAGPKNITPESTISGLLKAHGIRSDRVAISRSSATYR